jgi:prepilin-type processing-associated H-X9-DG protein
VWGGNWNTWAQLIYPYTKNIDLYTSPNRTDVESLYLGYALNSNSSNDDYPNAYDASANTGGGTPPGNWTDGGCSNGVSVVSPNQHPVSLAAAVAPASTIWFYDSNSLLYQDDFITWDSMEAAAADPDFAGDVNTLDLDGSETIAQLFLSGGSRVDNSTLIKEPHRFSKGMNIAWLDGHVKWLRPSAIKGEWWSVEQVPQGVEMPPP